ncbi:DUF2520 domain-containing protein [Sporosalibacterium faouarense]|uniref:DUF2520 domain-containing protein n=1 Tax=Sporosalibacterium faouarense TaxID=516123 RepID=UPI00192B6E62
MKIGFIGAGKVGTAFGIYLNNQGFAIHGYHSRTIESAQRAADLTDSIAENTIDKLVKNSDIIFITTNDDEIASICNFLVEENLLSKGQILVHMSGASSSKIFHRAKEKGCSVYSLHPLQSFADIEKAVKDLKNTVFSLEGDEDKIDILENMLKSMGNSYFKIESDEKPIYHAAACVVSNYLVSLMDYGLSLFESIGINKTDGFKALHPLIEGSIKNIYELGTEQALTGPIVRGDTETILKHLKAIQNKKADSLKLYQTLGLETLNLAKRAKLRDENKEKELENILKEV